MYIFSENEKSRFIVKPQLSEWLQRIHFFSKSVMPSYPDPTGIICDAYPTSGADDDNFNSNCSQYEKP